MEIIIGSTALKYWYPELNREPKDLDIVVEDSRKYNKKKGIEYLENPILLKYEGGQRYISPNMLLTLKMSHMFWDFNWEKHMWDIQFLLDRGCEYIPSVLVEFVDYWMVVKPKVKRPDLKLDSKNFFDNAVNNDEAEHDYLHTLINPIPMYTRLLKEGAEVELDESKWHKLTFDEKCDVVFEETAVMAYERHKNKYYKMGYEIQLEQNIQRHFPRYIAIFAILNYKKVLTPKFNYINRIKNGLQEN